jgi:uncharacterized membrane protein
MEVLQSGLWAITNLIILSNIYCDIRAVSPNSGHRRGWWEIKVGNCVAYCKITLKSDGPTAPTTVRGP